MIRVTIWNEFVHERDEPEVQARYPDGIHGVLRQAFEAHDEFQVRTATLDQPEVGLTSDVLDSTDVMVWWGHKAHDDVPDQIARRVHERVLEGMGFVALHSAHFSKPFKYLMGTHCSLKWRKTGEKERVWNLAPAHPITQGIGEYFELELSEMYGERFDIPEPERTIFISWYAGGEVFRSGCTWTRGNGKVFYFSPGDQAFPIYHDQNVQRVIVNATRWAAATVRIPFSCPAVDPIEPIRAHDR